VKRSRLSDPIDVFYPARDARDTRKRKTLISGDRAGERSHRPGRAGCAGGGRRAACAGCAAGKGGGAGIAVGAPRRAAPARRMPIYRPQKYTLMYE
jgi:hypothetical protein